ncbi:O-antigen polymerase [Nitrosomonas sp.]|uniref:O-antigen polymerase n=1 Tax=Nitrosomonas sp. TaxID=42353 RepID=UPI002630518B|nr:O-antigen polymerase [Nitrosomonas sp.]MCW5600360.1 oligosaccharide repeat unit polymerase [Nitrosomonas sp.]
MEVQVNINFYTVTCILLLLLNSTASLYILRKGITLNPMAYFIVFFSVQILGTFPLLDLNLDADFWHAASLAVASYTILFFCFLFYPTHRFNLMYKRWKDAPEELLSNKRLYQVIFLLGLSVVLTVLHYQIVGYNLFALSLQTNVDDFTSMRLASYAGDAHTGAGLFNQFKNTILPICYFALLIYLHAKGRMSIFWIYVAVMTPFLLYALMGSGQRAYLFFALIIFVIFMINQRKKRITLLLAFGGGFLVLFGTYSVLLGRQADEGEGLFSVIEQLYYRIFIAQQTGSTIGFRYVYNLDYKLGYEWFENFRGLIPGIKGGDLPHRVHEYIYGSYRGTVPVSLWVTAYYNFGIAGVAFIAFLWMTLLMSIFIFLLKLRKDLINRFVASALVLYCGLSVFSHPAQIFINGLFGLLFIFLIIGISRIPKTINSFTKAKPIFISSPL